jgi:myo-inositol-1(or 4)-monophosphatase
MKYRKELELLKGITKNIYSLSQTLDISSSFKGEQDIVTTTDLYIEKELIKKIKEDFPSDSFHTEEFNSKTLVQGRTWIIDPIDGTSNYASKLELYCIQIALFDEGDIVLSYIYVPEFEKEYYAIKGYGAYKNGIKYNVDSYKTKTNFLISMVGITIRDKDKTYYKKIIDYAMENKYKLRMLGSIGVELSYMSEGIFDLFYTNVTNIWDLYPGILLLKEAGAILVNETGESYSLGDENLFVFKNKQGFESLIDLLKRI